MCARHKGPYAASALRGVGGRRSERQQGGGGQQRDGDLHFVWEWTGKNDLVSVRAVSETCVDQQWI